MPRRILLTGATGFVGSRLARALHARGLEVHALHRRGSDRSALDGATVTWHEGDVTDAASLERAIGAVSGGEAADSGDRPWVAHAAAVISYRTRDRALQRAVNVEGTRNVLQASLRARVSRLLHVSSVVALGPARPGEVRGEDGPPRGAELRCDYLDTKRAAEELALAAARELDVVVINPGAIFGPGTRGPNTVRFLRQLARGDGFGPFAPPGALSVVGVEDVAEGACLALERGARGRRYLLVESALESLEVFRIAAEELGTRPPRWTLPRPLWRAACAGARAVDAALPLGLLAPQALRMLGARWAFDGTRARTELGWKPRPFRDVLRETIASLRARGLLP